VAECTLQDCPIPEELLGSFREYEQGPDQPQQLGQQFARDGYVLLRSVLDREQVLAARREVFGRLQAVDEIDSPAEDGIATGRSQRDQIESSRGDFWQSVSEGTALRRVTHGSRLQEIVAAVLAQDARPHDLMYLRPTPVGRSTSLHCDYPFFAGYSPRIVTVWLPLGDIAVSDGPLTVVEGSHRFEDVIQPMLDRDYRVDHSDATIQTAAYDHKPTQDVVSMLRDRQTRLLTTEFQSGDVIVFSGTLMHGSLDNHSPVNRVRLSVDVRYQPAADPADDERYFGSHPRGSKGAGYADMRGARPLTEAW